MEIALFVVLVRDDMETVNKQSDTLKGRRLQPGKKNEEG
jgi:hypothetical protein